MSESGDGLRVPIPPGYATPTELTHILRTRRIATGLKAQQIYNWIKLPGDKCFPHMIHEDGRKIVPIDEGIQWLVEYWKDKADKEAAKAAAAARKAEAAVSASNITPLPKIEPPDEDEWHEFDSRFT